MGHGERLSLPSPTPAGGSINFTVTCTPPHAIDPVRIRLRQDMDSVEEFVRRSERPPSAGYTGRIRSGARDCGQAVPADGRAIAAAFPRDPNVP
ncbi:hypothetical protein Axi01nite_71270 [Actinoplanes xinjiangensis]|nr:hypothetical protein Axi01nite_71270 [Actinoplanes xinjiangensis]